MIDRGLRRAFDPAVEHEARDVRGDRPRPDARRSGPGRARPARAADVHDRPGHRARLRRCDLGARPRTDGSRRCGSTSPTCRRTCARARWSTARPTAAGPACTCPGAVEPMLPDSAVQRRLLAGARAGPAGGHGRAGARRRAAFAAAQLLPVADPLRRAAGLRAASTGSSPATERAAEPWGAPLAAARRGAAALGGSAEARRRGGARLRRAGVRVRPRRERGRRRAGRADRVAPADRAADDRRQRAGGDAARVAPGADAVPRARATRRRRPRSAADRPAGVARGADAAGARRAISLPSRPPM